jgi:glycosyltransferase involved in cell wall biosynthesis
MKIAHVVDSMEMGGAETLVSQMCMLQRQQGQDPSVYAVAALGALGERLLKEGFSVQPNVGTHLVDSTRNFSRIFKKLRPDVVHFHNPTPTIYGAPAARLAGVPSIISTRHSLVAPPLNRAAELKYAIAARFCDWIVGICDATTTNLRATHLLPNRDIVRIYNGTVAPTRTRVDQCPPKSGFTLVYVGRLAPVKDHFSLLNGFHGALQSMPHLRLWMVGDGSERQALEAEAARLEISNEVTFWGQQLDVAPFFSAADAFIMSSKSEGLPMSLLQAFSLGIPAIVTDVGGMAEVVRFAKAGLTVPVSTPAEMTRAILRMASDDTERRQFSINAQAAFESNFTLEIMANAYMKLYRDTPRARRLAKF